MLKILGRNTSGNVQKVLWLLKELGIDYAREDYGRQFGNTDGAYLDLNPTGKVPTLIDGDLVLRESNTILRYVSNRHDAAFYPADARARALVELWMDWLLASLNTPYLAIFREAKKPPEERSAAWAANEKELVEQLALLDSALAGREYLAESFSIADIALGPVVARCLDFPVERPDFLNLATWRARISARPAFAKAVGA